MDILKIAWEQIDKYDSAELLKEKIVNVNKEKMEYLLLQRDNENSLKAKKVILAVRYNDAYHDIPEFIEWWGDTIIPCPFCDGYENRDRILGIVANSKIQLDLFPKMVQNLTSKIKVFVSPKIKIESLSYQNELSKLNIPVYRGIITKVNHNNTKVESVTLESGENIQFDTLLWIPQVKPIQLIQRLIEKLWFRIK